MVFVFIVLGQEGLWFVCYMTVTPEGSIECGFMEKLGIEPVTPGLQDIGLSPAPRRLHMCDYKGCTIYVYQLI